VTADTAPCARCGAACDGREASGRARSGVIGRLAVALERGDAVHQVRVRPGVAGHGQQPDHPVKQFRVLEGSASLGIAQVSRRAFGKLRVRRC
jgi:hypothetical protein